MAIPFVRVRPISKAKGESAGNLFAYINRVDGWEAKANLDETVIPYSSKPPAGFDTMQQVFKDADTYERSNGVVAKELTIAVPRELNVDEARELMFKICQRYEPTRHLSAVTHYNDHNPHIHLLLLERQNDHVDRPKEQFFKRYNSSKDPAETGTPKFPNAAKDRRAFLDNARDIVESETNKILARKDLELISFDAKNDDTMLPPAPHLGAKLHQPMLKALEEKKANPSHDPAILRHPKVVKYLERQEAQQHLIQAEILHELANKDRQELAKPVHQVQLKQTANINKMQQVLETQQAIKLQEMAIEANERARVLKEREEAFKERERARLLAEREAKIFEQQEAQAIADNERLLAELEQEERAAQEAQAQPTANINAWASRLTGSAKTGMNDYLKAANKKFDEGEWVDAKDWLEQQEQQEKSQSTNKQSGPKL